MDNSGIYVGLDIGTTSIKVIVAEKVKDQINVLGVGNVPSQGVHRGIIVNISKASKSIKDAVSKAEEKASVQIHNVIVGIPANLLKIEPCSGMLAISDQSKEINDDDVRKVAASAMVKNLPPERRIIDAIPDEFVVDGFNGIQDPRGMVGVRLEMHGHLITGPKTIIHNTGKAVKNAGLNPVSFTIGSLAQSKIVLDDGEQDFGTTLIDIGGGQTTAAVVRNHHLKDIIVDSEGGEYVTKDISVVLNTSFKNAEAIKRNYGYANSIDISGDNRFPVDVVGQNKPVNISEKMLSEIIQARLEQIFSRIKHQLDDTSALNLPGGIVLTGGVAALPGISDLAADDFDTNVKVYIPNQMGLRHPSFALPLSLVAYQASLTQIDRLVKSVIKDNGAKGRHHSQVASDHHRSVRRPVAKKREVPRSQPKKEKNSKRHHIVGDGIKKFFNDFFD